MFDDIAHLIHFELVGGAGRTIPLVSELAKAQLLTIIIQAVQVGGAGSGLSGSDQTALTDPLSRERRAALGHRNPVPNPTANAAPRVTRRGKLLLKVQAHLGRYRAARRVTMAPVDDHNP